jgi:hypothetical protein
MKNDYASELPLSSPSMITEYMEIVMYCFHGKMSLLFSNHPHASKDKYLLRIAGLQARIIKLELEEKVITEMVREADKSEEDQKKKR